MSAPETGSSSLHRGASTIRPVVTQPPWARDEPPSPELEAMPISDLALRLSASVQSGSAQNAASSSGASVHSSAATTLPDGRRWRFQSMLSQLRRASGAAHAHHDHEPELVEEPEQPPESSSSYFPSPPTRPSPLRLQIPRNAHSFTLAQSKTPGWATPWAPSNAPRQGGPYMRSGSQIPPETAFNGFQGLDEQEKDLAPMSAWKRRRRTFRSFILTNAYVPLLCRIANFSFTTATLGVAIRLRQMEIDNGALGAVGSSPILAIIFSPLTLVHVLTAIYLEYFGRPLGLWRTSGKLAHTLSEVLFICIWSGSVSVAFDNYFTSPLLCTPQSWNTWWDHLPQQSSPLPDELGRYKGGVADSICGDQLVIVCLEFVGLALYNVSLVISLFRIFEKVKIHTTAARGFA